MNIPSLALIAFRRQSRERRKVLGLSQKELAVRIADAGVKLSAKDINDIETQARGVSLDEALAIAEALLVQLDDLLTDPAVGNMGASIEAAGALARSIGGRFAKHDQASEAPGVPFEPGAPQTRTLTAQELHFKRTPPGKHLISEIRGLATSRPARPGRPLESALATFSDERGKGEDRIVLRVDFPLECIEGVNDPVEIRLESNDEVVTARAFNGGDAIGSCSVPVGQALIVRLGQAPQSGENIVGTRHENSLAGYGAASTAPATTGEAATSPVGDTVRDATDTNSSPPTAGRAE